MVLEHEVHIGPVVHPVGRVETQLTDRTHPVTVLGEAVTDVE